MVKVIEYTILRVHPLIEEHVSCVLLYITCQFVARITRYQNWCQSASLFYDSQFELFALGLVIWASRLLEYTKLKVGDRVSIPLTYIDSEDLKYSEFVKSLGYSRILGTIMWLNVNRKKINHSLRSWFRIWTKVWSSGRTCNRRKNEGF